MSRLRLLCELLRFEDLFNDTARLFFVGPVEDVTELASVVSSGSIGAIREEVGATLGGRPATSERCINSCKFRSAFIRADSI
mmetsp:Transcript_11597/g.23586  ORF Transcript_11597/g.23586 Transcript_11597/m.23586 type:complete len:82 (+) Transcript_11597:707-952(+)